MKKRVVGGQTRKVNSGSEEFVGEEITRATIKNKRDIYPTAIDTMH